jgi:hypothetical protein
VSRTKKRRNIAAEIITILCGGKSTLPEQVSAGGTARGRPQGEAAAGRLRAGCGDVGVFHGAKRHINIEPHIIDDGLGANERR